MSADIGLIGLAVMGENLILNMDSHGTTFQPSCFIHCSLGFTVACFNRTTSKVDEFLAGRAKGTKIIGTKTPADLCATLKVPRKVMIMVRAGDAVDATIKSLLPHLEKVFSHLSKTCLTKD
jgi:6-phosphogluconate dehydrogenase